MKLLALMVLLAVPLAAQPVIEMRTHPAGPTTPNNGVINHGDVFERRVIQPLFACNVGSSVLTVTSVSVLNAVNCTWGSAATFPRTANPGGSTSVSGFVDVVALGTFSLDLVIASDDAVTPSYTVTISGNGAAAADIRVRYSGAEIVNLGTQNIGSYWQPGINNDFVLQVDNWGIAGSPDLTWGTPALVVISTSNCAVTPPADPTTALAVGSDTSLTYNVIPSSVGNFSFELAIHTNDPNEAPWSGTFNGMASTDPIPRLSGGVGGAVIHSGTFAAMGNVQAGIAAPRTITVQNIGVGTLMLTGSPIFLFTLEMNCSVALITPPSSTLAPSQTSNSQIEITGTAVGPYSFTLAMQSNSPVIANYTIFFQGDVLSQPSIQLRQEPGSTVITHTGVRDLGDLPVGQPFEIAYTVRNNGGSDLILSGVPPVAFTNLLNCDVVITQALASLTLAPSDEETFLAEVTPLAAGTFSFQFEIESNDPGVPLFEYTITGTASNSGGGGGGGGGGGDDEACSTGHGKGPWLGLLAALAACVLALRARAARQ